jgi:hypothetical protein
LPSYDIPVQRVDSTVIHIEDAKDYDDAVEKALEEAQNLPGLCNNCSGGGYGHEGPMIDEGEWDLDKEE